MIKKYIKKPIPVEARIWEGTGLAALELSQWSDNKVQGVFNIETKNFNIQIKTLEGVMVPNVGDYVVKGPAGEFWFVRKEIFEATYEEIL